ncbi:MAG TPA: prepilin-type N-terminal cleavage/methylation domain-containing protein [Candidatus Saccharimonadales bacterium]|jgi:prepilin-type N-terminal cleavage/methylation domain-containing protein
MSGNFKSGGQAGFSVVEIIVAIAIFPLLVFALQQGYDAVRRSYTVSKQLNEMYAVLSACPEIDRALEYDSVTSATNCYPNNSFKAEGGSGQIISYQPTLTVTNASALVNTDPLYGTPDSKVINIKVGYQDSVAPPVELRLLITRNGIGQQ